MKIWKPLKNRYAEQPTKKEAYIEFIYSFIQCSSLSKIWTPVQNKQKLNQTGLRAKRKSTEEKKWGG